MNILITGTSSGIGASLQQHLSESKFNNVIGLSTKSCDVTEYSEVEKFMAKQLVSSLDVVICCAAVQGPIGFSMNQSPVVWKRTVVTNLVGTYNTIYACFPYLVHSRMRRSKIFCFSGGGASKSRPRFSAYASSKTGLVRMVETLADEWGHMQIDIIAVAPGSTKTRMTDEVIDLGADVCGPEEHAHALKTKDRSAEICKFIDHMILNSDGVTGRLVSIEWDPWAELPNNIGQFTDKERYKLRRIT